MRLPQNVDNPARRLTIPERRSSGRRGLVLDPLPSAVNRPGSVPTMTFVPLVTVMGRSVFSLRVMQGMPRMVVSSWMPPESVSVTRLPSSSAMNSR